MLRFPILTIGAMLCGLGVLLTPMALLDVAYGSERAKDFLICAAVCLVFGGALLISLRGPAGQFQTLGKREAFLLTALTWIVFPVFAATPFLTGPHSMDLTDAIFESVSGLTTTGSTVLANLDEKDPAILLWRSILHWLGGIGIILMAVVILPFLQVGGMQLFQTESSVRSDEKLIARPGHFVGTIALTYVGLTAVCALMYTIFGMTIFDAVNHAMATLSTGGFSTHDASMGFFESYSIYWTATLFMLAGAVPFTLYYRTLRRDALAFLRDSQVRVFISLIALVSILSALALTHVKPLSFGGALTQVAFNIVSIITTTGFATTDYTLWGPGFIGMFFALTFLGGCSGSTSGGIKIYRFQILFILSRDYFRRLYTPHFVQPRRYENRRIDDEIALSVLAFLAIFVGALSVGFLLLTLCGLDFDTALSGAATALCNVGPGVGKVIGPAGNFSTLPDSAKWILIFLMLLGRLELFTLLVIFDPRFWER